MGTDQDETGYRRQFNAAVSVIQSLPKDGAYRPSYEEMLRFYGYYKQATVGPCNISRPPFWDPIGKYKWDAWSKLGAMSQEDAMCAYIREMKIIAQKIIDTIPLEDKSPDMFEPFRPLYDVIPDMPRPPGSFFQTSEQESCEDTKEVIPEGDDMEEQQSSDTIQYEAISEETELGTLSELEELKQSESLGETTRPLQSEQKLQSCGSENEYSDSVEQLGSDEECEENGSKIYPHLFQASDAHKKTKTRPRRKSADRRKDDNIGPVPHSGNDVWLRSPSEEDSGDTSTGLQTRCQSAQYHLSPQIKATVEALQATVQGLCQRLQNLERALQEQRQYTQEQSQRSHKKKRHPVLAKSRTFLFIVIWPFVAHWLLRRFLWRKR
ncbi:acyl-CoA-binding domain-containing protein 4 isoform X1 [Bufo bufo]|uniref:acyl-CoA-binding domain-containing protein 4 isoform X1 n=1 Tax=Bufo bufo TaxID=8384 RepID=UPI001ABE8C07|nr:acyl-CoA-binding domain-containing protein 4 isoform X1 [Bufo bufo]